MPTTIKQDQLGTIDADSVNGATAMDVMVEDPVVGSFYGLNGDYFNMFRLDY